MDDDTRSKDLTLPEDEPWMSHGFISKIAAQVSLPYRRPKDGVKEIERRNGSLVVRYVSGADCLPYGKYPRLFELWACTMIKTNDPCFDPETNTLHLGTTFREFLRLIEVGAMAESAAGFEGGDERAKERIARLVQLGSLVEAMCSTDVMDNYTSREDLRATVTKALEHNVRTSDGMNWNLHDLVYEALSEEWGRRDGEISDLWADDGPSGYQPPSYEPVNPERRTPQTPSDGLI